MKKNNFHPLSTLKTIALRAFFLIVICVFCVQISNSQVECQDETQVALVGLDRKDWQGDGTFFTHSEGALHNFTLPLNTTGDCMKITNVEITFTQVNVDASGLDPFCPVPNQYFLNISKDCPSLAPASCPDNTTVFIHAAGYPGAPVNFPTQTFASPTFEFAFGENIGVDIVPVMVTGCPQGQTAISSGGLVLDYEICVTVTIGPATSTIDVNLGPDINVCPNGTTTIDAGSFTDVDYLWSNNEITQMITVGQGIYTVTVTDNSGSGCTDEGTIELIPHPTSPITFNPTNPSGCDGGLGQVSVVESYGTYNWQGGATGQTVNLNPGTYNVTIIDGNSCEFESSVTVGNETSPDAGNSNFITVCNDGSLTNMDLALGAHDAGGTWNDDDVSGIDVNINPLAVDFSTLTPNTYAFTYTVPGTTPCLPDDATITVQVFGASEGGDNNFIAVCDGEQVDLTTLLSSGATAGGTFADDNFTSQLTVNNFSTTGLAGGSYDFTYSVGAAPCQPDEAIMTVQVLAAVEAGGNNITTVCEGAQVDLSLLLSSDATTGGSFSDDDGTTQLTVNIFNTTGLSGGSYDFTYFVGIAGSGCGDDMAFFTVTVESSVTSGGDVGDDLCEGVNIDLYTLLTGEDTGGIFSDISGNGGLSNNMLNTTGLPIGINEYQYLVGDGISCPKDSSLISINIVAAPNLTIATDSIEVCADNCETITYNLTGTAPFTFNASIFSDDGTLIGGGITNTNDNTFTITACNQTNVESYTNDTLNLLIDSSYTITIPSIQDGNCTNSFGGLQDSLFIRGLDYARFDLDTFACINDTLTINGTDFFVGNDFLLDTIPGSRCDSIISIMVNFPPQADSLLMVPLCAGQSTTINGTLYNDANQSGVDTLFNMSASGCDSIIMVQITPTTGITIERNDTLCMDESIVIGGQTFDFNNQIDQIILGGSGCDTTINVALNFHTIEEGNVVGPFCSDFTVTIDGNLYDFNNRVGIDTLENASIDGCDSIVNTNLSFFPLADSMLIVPLCAGTDIMLNGTLYNDANLIGTDTLFNQSSNGCDSIVMVQITSTTGITIDRNDTLCMDEFIVVGGQTFDFNNQMDQVILSGSGCDTTVNVALNFHLVQEGDLSGPFCTDYSTEINGNTYDFNNRTGVEPFPNASQSGCDSILNINLSFYPNATSTQSVALCTGADTIINGTLYNDTNLNGMDTLVNQSANGCDSIITITITFNPCQFNVVLTPTDDACGDGATGSIQVETDSPAGETFSIRLTDEDGNSEIILNQVGPNIGGIFNFLEPGVYTIVIFDTSSMTVYTNTITIVSTNTPISGSWSVISPISCENGTGSIMYTATGGQEPYMYNWSTPTGNTPTADDLEAGIYFVTVTDNLGCSVSDNYIFQDGVTQVPDLIIMNPSCGSATDGSIQITNLDNQYGPYTITVNGDIVDSTFIDGLTNDTYSIVITDNNLCTIEITEVLVAVNQLEAADYAVEYTITDGDSVILVGTIEPGDFTFEWTADDALSCTDCSFPLASPIETTLFTLMIFDENGCSQSIFVTVFVDEKEEEEEEEEEIVVIQIANIFSPNYDNINDEVIFDFGPDMILDVEIYDRWGNSVFQAESVDGTISWDGFYNGNILNSGVYVYNLQISDLEGNVNRKFGDIMLMR